MNLLPAQRPPALRRGDTVALTAPASSLHYEACIPQARAVLEGWGLQVVEGDTLRASWLTFAGTDELRRNEYQRFLDDPSIRAILSARGGYGSSRILQHIDYQGFRKNPKWVVGFSDITAVLLSLYSQGFESLHGAMPKTFELDESGYSLETLRQLLFGQDVVYQTATHPLNRTGEAAGTLIGGNLCLLVHMLGTKAFPELSGKILFLEETEEFHYSVDRYLVQLHRAGQLAALAGLVVGSFSGLRDTPEAFGMNTNEIIQYWTKDYTYPVAYGFPVGHESGNLALPVGRAARLSVGSAGVRLGFS